MKPERTYRAKRRRFLAINFRIGTRDNGYFAGPVLVSTPDYQQFHLWDEPGAALLDIDEYQIVKLYPRDLTYDEVSRQFAKDFPPDRVLRATNGWITLDGSSAEQAGQRCVLAA